MRRIIIDTDVGGDIDDVLTLSMAIHSPELVIEGVTTVGRRSDQRAKIAAHLLELNGMGHVPVAAGFEHPFVGEWNEWDVPNQYGEELAHTSITTDEDAVDLLIRLTEHNPGEVAIVAIGALTNVARAIERSPSFRDNVKEIVLMGGAFTFHYLECNIVCDPEAAEIVFESGIPVTAAGLEVCLDLRIDTDEAIRVLKDADTVQSRFLAILVARWKEVGVNRPIIMFDAIPLVYLMDKGIVQTEERVVRIETAGKHTRGMTFSFETPFSEELPEIPHVKVCSEVKGEELMQLFAKRGLLT
ncbi:nucleoside hydrolase [Paenibacillus mendelii]|uniref:Nucleoside hydrolase n=1 Tax=Paenibacillus mendelii TaxID=206163 RepID=A0ABV6JFP0_9BACL|nr:nucleoside hydrolase [Paenibacillus mendelii]